MISHVATSGVESAGVVDSSCSGISGETALVTVIARDIIQHHVHTKRYDLIALEKQGEIHVVGDDIEFTRRAFQDLARIFKSAPTQVQLNICDTLCVTCIIPLAGKDVQLYIYPVAIIQSNRECADVKLEIRLVPCSKDAIDNYNSLFTLHNAMDMYAEINKQPDGSDWNDRSAERY